MSIVSEKWAAPWAALCLNLLMAEAALVFLILIAKVHHLILPSPPFPSLQEVINRRVAGCFDGKGVRDWIVRFRLRQ